MRKITHIVLHCTATAQTATVKSIQNYWKSVLKWKSPGYHHIIMPDGTVVDLLPIDQPSNGVYGHNAHSIHISYIGGVDAKGKAVDNRTVAQMAAQIELLARYQSLFPEAKICGHRDFPGVTKACPSFDVAAWLKEIKFFD
jgi:N-acetylmuramoyl-L-alanine amidase